MKGQDKKQKTGLVDIEELLIEALNANLDPSIFDIQIDIPRAKNVIDFVKGPGFLNMRSPDGSCRLWAKQAELSIKLFSDYCTFCSDMDYVANVPFGDTVEQMEEKIKLLEYGVCPSCNKNRRDMFDIMKHELVSCMGQRSGKSVTSSCVVYPYQLHRYLTLPNPAKYFGMLDSTVLLMTFTALAVHQVVQSCWEPFIGTIGNSPWFKEYHRKLREEEKKNHLKLGSLLKINETHIAYRNKGVGVGFGAADGRTLRGRTRIACCIDELGWFDANNKEAKKINADETYAGLNNSLETVRQFAQRLWDAGDYDVPTGIMVNISSPSSKFDKIMQLLKHGDVDPGKVCSHLPSWEASPIFKRENFRFLEQTQPKVFWRDFGAIPPLADEPWIEDDRFVYAVEGNIDPVVEYDISTVKDNVNGSSFVAASVRIKSHDKKTPRILTIDQGETNNHYAIGLFSLHESKHEDGQPRHVIHCDGAVSVAPMKLKNTDTILPIHFPSMFRVIESICNAFNVIDVVYDRWQSTGEIHRLREKGINAERYSPTHNDFVELRNCIFSGNYKSPKFEIRKLEDVPVSDSAELMRVPYSHFALQLATVREVGKRLLKPIIGEDDLARTLVLASKYMLSNIKKYVSRSGSNRGRPGSIGVFRTKGGSAGASRPSGSTSNRVGLRRSRNK